MKAVVYFLLRDIDGAVKIGTTAKVSRIKSQLHFPYPSVLLGYVFGGKNVEAELHQRFYERKIRHGAGHEWFSPTPQMIGFIRDNAIIENDIAHELNKSWQWYYQQWQKDKEYAERRGRTGYDPVAREQYWAKKHLERILSSVHKRLY